MSQLYVCFRVDSCEDLNCILACIRLCRLDIKTFILWCRLCLNDGKTEVVVLSSSANSHRFNLSEVLVGGCMITLVPAAHDVGVIIDSHMQMEQHISAVCRVAYSQLHAIAHICSSLTQSSAATLTLSLVISELDYRNFLLYNHPDCLLHRLQLMQNCAARMASK